MLLNALTAISPIDGRYFQTTAPLARYFSEFALMQYRIRVEVEYFITLCGVLPELRHFPKEKFTTLRSMYTHFDEASAEKIKTIEKTTGHDVKAVEYLIKRSLINSDLPRSKSLFTSALLPRMSTTLRHRCC